MARGLSTLLVLAAVLLVSTGQEVTELGPEDSEDPGVQDAQLAYDTADKVMQSRYLMSSLRLPVQTHASADAVASAASAALTAANEAANDAEVAKEGAVKEQTDASAQVKEA